MDNYFLLRLIQFILNEEESGRALTPDNYSDLLRVTSLELARQVVKNYEDGQDVTDMIQRFKKDEDIEFVNGEALLPGDYYRKSFLLAGSVWVEFVTDAEFANRRKSALMPPSAEYPIVRIIGGGLEILPDSITAGELGYIRRPITPFFDYYYDAFGRIIPFGPKGATHTLLSGQQGRAGQTSGQITSVNEELDWNDNEKLIIVGMICSKAGVNIGEQGVVEYAEMLKQQQS